MIPDLKPVLQWFGFSRRERRSTFILLIIIVLVGALRYIIPDKAGTIEDISASLTSFGKTLRFYNEEIEDSENTFITAADIGFDSLKNAGFPSVKSGTDKRYRDRYAGIRKTSGSTGINDTDKNLSARIVRSAKTRKDYARRAENGSIQSKLLNLNSCDSVSLDRLPGIGPVLSVRIVKYRNLLGGFISREQLKEVYGLSGETYDLVAERVFADSSMVKKINVNIAGFKDLMRHPYFDKYDVQAILKYRELKGMITSLEELKNNKILTPEKAEKIKQYLSFEK